MSESRNGATAAGSTSAAQVIAADDLLISSLLPVLAKFGISVELFRALRHTAASKDGLTMGDLGRLMACSPPATTRAIDRLVTDGLAYRRPDAIDRRRVLVVVSESGRALWESIVEAIDN